MQSENTPGGRSVAHELGQRVQTKLTIGAPGDRYEQEADAMADTIVKGPSSPEASAKGGTSAEGSQLHRKPIPPSSRSSAPVVNRQSSPSVASAKDGPSLQAAFESEEAAPDVQTKLAPSLQRAGGDNTPTPPSGFDSQLNSTRGGGSAIPESSRSQMEPHLGDLSGVRVHTDSQAADMSSSIGARAFTHGQDIYFNEGEYNPGSQSGQHLLAHEATHTVQQSGGVQPKLIQRQELSDEEKAALEKELASADQEQTEAIDPGPAQQAQAEATEGLPDEMLEPEETQVPDGEAEETPAEGELPPEGGQGPGQGAPPPPPPAENLSTVGKDLAQEAANVCGDAEASATELAQNEQTHEDAATMQQQTEAAVVQPEAEGQALSNTQQVGEVEGQPAPSVSEAEAKQTMDTAVRNAVPSSIKSLNEFKSKGKAQIAGAQVMAVVQKDVDQVKNTYNEMEQTPQPTPQATPPTELPPVAMAPPTPELNLGQDAVPPLK